MSLNLACISGTNAATMEDAIATLFCLLFFQEWKPRLALTLSTQGTQGLVCVNALGLGEDLRVKPRLLFTGAWCYLIPPLTHSAVFVCASSVGDICFISVVSNEGSVSAWIEFIGLIRFVLKIENPHPLGI